MPYCFEYDAGGRILRCEGWDRISDAEMREVHRRLYRYFESLQPAVFIMDASRITAFDVKSETMRYLASGTPPGPRDIPRYIVASSAFMYGMARMFQIYADEHLPNLRVVRSLADALRDLGVSGARFEALPQEFAAQQDGGV